jgi:UDP:flavonoid glycosyltransferase YjiC (YdhE family)
MARAIFAWELGGELGHARRTLQVARELRVLGHETAFVFLDLASLGAPGNEGLEWFQAPIVPPSRAPSRAPLNPSEILLNRGWGDANGVAGALRGWLGLYALWKPDVVVADYAPGAQLAARAAGVPRVAIGSGFSTPAAHDPMPAMRSWIATDESALRRLDAQLLAAIRQAYARVTTAPPPEHASELFRAEATLVCSWPEIDPFGPREDVEYLGPQDDPRAGASESWRSESRPRILAYLKPRDPRFAALLDALRAVAAESIVAAPGLPPPQVAALSSEKLRIHGEPLALDGLMEGADLCVCHSGPGIVGRALAAGVALALLPQQLEQYLVGRRVVTAGAGVMVAPDEAMPDLRAWLAQALGRAELRRAAAASTLRARVRASAAQRIADGIENRAWRA